MEEFAQNYSLKTHGNLLPQITILQEVILICIYASIF